MSPRPSVITNSMAVSILAASITISPPAAGEVAAVDDGVLFNRPASHNQSDQYRIPNHVANLIRQAAPGSQIRVVVSYLTLTGIADELIAAHQRGITVQVIVDARSRTIHNDDTGQDEPNPAYVQLVEGLGTDKDAPSWIMHCTPGGACIGNQNTPVNNNKFFLFSDTDGARDVVVQSSANLTNTQARNGWNNAVTVAGNTDLYDGYRQYFADLAAMNKTNDYYRKNPAGQYKTYIFPRAGTNRSTDTVYNILGNIDCPGTKIRVAMMTFTRRAVAQRLWNLDDQGCPVQVLYTDLRTRARDELIKPGGEHGGPSLRHGQGIYVDADGNPQDMYVHSKYLLIDGSYLGKAKKLVFTGSPNYTVSALRENDEVLLKVDNAGIYGAFHGNYTDLWNSFPDNLAKRRPPMRADLPPYILREADLGEN